MGTIGETGIAQSGADHLVAAARSVWNMIEHSRDIVPDREIEHHLLGLEGTTNPKGRTPVRGQTSDILPVDLDASGGRRDEAAEYVKQRRLAGAVWADQPRHG